MTRPEHRRKRRSDPGGWVATGRYHRRVRRHHTATRAIGLALAVALAAGCTDGGDPTVSAGGDTTSSTGATTAPSSTPPTTVAAVTPPITAPAPVGAGRAYLTAVRVAATSGGGSRVVFEFEPNLPGYRIEYIERPVTEDGSGDVVEVAGEAVLQVRMEEAAGARIEGERVIPTYTGPKRVPSGGTGGVVTEAVDIGDYEAVVTWAVGLGRRVPAISVSTLSGPSRLVIDVPAPPP